MFTKAKSCLIGAIAGVLSLVAVVGAQERPDAMPAGRAAIEIKDGAYPASYFPNTEILGSNEMRIVALGTGMPNQTKAAV